jgi:hypothetical protein
MDKNEYEGPSDLHYYTKVCTELNIPTVPLIETTVLSSDLIEKYSTGIDKINGQRFEGVVLKYDRSSFKIINLSYDERK